MYDDICFFIKVINLGKFSYAAKELNIAQSTISRKIASLEESLHTILIKRDSRTLELTEDGMRLYSQFKDTSNDVNNLISQVIDRNTRYNTVLNLLLPVGMVNFKFSQKLAQLTESFEGIQLNLTYYAGTVNTENYIYDIAIVSSANKPQKKTAKLIYSSKVILAGSPEYIAKYGLCQSREELNNHIVMGNTRVLTENYKVSLFHEKESLEYPLKVNYKFYLNSFAEAKNLICAGIAIGGVLIDDITQELNNGSLIRILPDYHFGFINYYLVSNFSETDIRYIKIINLLEDFFTDLRKIQMFLSIG